VRPQPASAPLSIPLAMGHAPFVHERRREVESHAVHADAVRAACRHEQERLGASRGGAVHGWRLRPLHLCRGGRPHGSGPWGMLPLPLRDLRQGSCLDALTLLKRIVIPQPAVTKVLHDVVQTLKPRAESPAQALHPGDVQARARPFPFSRGADARPPQDAWIRTGHCGRSEVPPGLPARRGASSGLTFAHVLRMRSGGWIWPRTPSALPARLALGLVVVGERHPQHCGH